MIGFNLIGMIDADCIDLDKAAKQGEVMPYLIELLDGIAEAEKKLDKLKKDVAQEFRPYGVHIYWEWNMESF